MNLSPTLAQFFSPAGLMSLINPAEAVKRGTKRVLPEAFYTQSSTGPVGTQVGYYRTTNNRDAAKLSNQSDPSRAVSVPGAEFRTVVGFGAKENHDVTPATLAALESPIPFVRQQAIMEVTRNVQNFYSRFNELRTQAIHSILANGAIYAGSDGQLQPTSSSAKWTYDPGIPSANSVTVSTGSTTQVGDWATTTTDIGVKLRSVIQSALKATGYRLTTVYYGLNVPSYLAKNETLQKYFQYNPLVNQAISIDNTIPQGFLGMKWVPVWEAGYTGGANSVTSAFSDDFLGFSPDVDSSWYELIPCGTPVPSNGVAQGLVTGAPDGTSATANMEIKYGFYSYGQHLVDPYTVRVIGGDYFAPIVKVPSVLYRGVCH